MKLLQVTSPLKSECVVQSDPIVFINENAAFISTRHFILTVQYQDNFQGHLYARRSVVAPRKLSLIAQLKGKNRSSKGKCGKNRSVFQATE